MTISLEERVEKIKEQLPSPDVLTFNFSSQNGKRFALVYADGIADKKMMGELIVKPLRFAKPSDTVEEVKLLLASPEVKEEESLKAVIAAVSGGDAALLTDGDIKYLIIGVKSPPGRAVAEPPTQVVIKGPREGFTEDIKTNIALVRKRIKSNKLQIKTVQTGRLSASQVAICYISGICPNELPQKIERQILKKEIDLIPDSSYIAGFMAKRPRSLFRRNGTCEKPDIFCAKLCEGRVGVIVDGSPIAITAPYILTEDFQSAEDYYSLSYRATTLRFLRAFAVFIGIYLPAFYICAQLFKIEFIPAKLLLKIASSVAGIPLSPSVEIFLTLFVLEVLNEASVRMPNYVGLALSVVGALVLGDTAVKAGVISTPAIIIIAFSAICLYTVPDFVETSATLRLAFLIVAGSLGTYGVLVLTAFILCYLVTEQDYGVPLLSPFAPTVKRDMKDSLLKANFSDLSKRPKTFKSKNRTRFKEK